MNVWDISKKKRLIIVVLYFEQCFWCISCKLAAYCKNYPLRLIWCLNTPFPSRFVNYVNEMGQTGATLKNMVHAVKSVSCFALRAFNTNYKFQFGIPKKIVDIRHAITHQNCPDIAELRYATNFCLDWLWVRIR